MSQLAKIRSVEAVEMRDSASNRIRRGQNYAKFLWIIFQTKFALFANLLTKPQVLVSHNFLSKHVLHTKYVVPKND